MLGEIVGAVGSLLGGLFNRDAAKDAAAKQNEMAERNIQLQKDFAQQGIRWKVADAKAAGIHPLYALGASTTSYAPVSVGTPVDTSMGSAIASASQDIGRAINSTRTQGEREDAFTKSVQSLSLQKMGLENELLSSQIAKLRAGTNPPMPAVGPVPIGDAEKADQMYLGTGNRWEHDPSVSNANTFENRYGEMSDWAFGPYVLWRDFNYNYRDRPGEPTQFEQLRSQARRRFGRPPSWLQSLLGHNPNSFDERFYYGRR